MDRQYFYIGGNKQVIGSSMFTYIQVVIPEGSTYEEAKAIALEHISKELDRYALHEILSGLGYRQNGGLKNG